MIEVPKNIVQILAPTASRYDISSTALSSILLQTVSAGGGDISSLPLSRRQVERSAKASITESSTSIKERFVIMVKGMFLICHFDGKQLAEFTNGLKSKKERLSVLVSSPSLDKAQILGAVPLDGQTGDDIFMGVLSLLEEFGILDRIFGMSFDTTASNTGPDQGACARLENHMKKALLWLACRRHVLELHIKHVASAVAEKISGRLSTGPTNTLFKRLQVSWPKLLPLIDMADLDKFDWKGVAGTGLEDQAEKSLQILTQFLKDKTFAREDYRELCELCVLFLGGAVPNFKFQYPGAYHNARYMAQSIYMLKFSLLLSKITWMLDVERREVKIMAEFIAIFYAVWWLQGYLGVNAPMNDLNAMHQMRMYKQYNNLVSETCTASWKRHTWYLTEELVVLCLADASCPFINEVAAALLQQKVMDSFPPGKPKLPVIPESFWPEDGCLPSLASFVGPRSHLIFSLLEFSSSDMDWLKFDSSDWEKFSGYLKFSEFVKNMAVVNDAGERGVKGIQEVVGKTSIESLRQDMLLTTAEDRKLHPNRGVGMESKAKLAKIM